MKRVYTTGDSEDVKMFIGTEVEHSPAHGKRTLFVVGIQDPEELARIASFEGIDHIYCGANQSFSVTGEWGTDEEQRGWEGMLTTLLKKGFWVTLDFDVKYTEWVLELCLGNESRFIPMVSVKMPYIDQLGYNACLKLDDKDFDATNPGVWVHSVHNLKDRGVFTDWSKYTKDEILD